MNNRDLEAKLKNAVEKSTPDLWVKVQSDISHKRGEVITMSGEKKKSKILSFISVLAAALVLIFAAVFGITNYNRGDLKPVSTVCLEAEPQIELSLNAYKVVLSATPKNEDGKKVLGTMKFEDTMLDVALNSILESMVKNGYLTKESNSVLISVEHQEKNKTVYLKNEVLKSVENNDFGLAAVVQSVESTKELKAQAEKLKVTLGKAEFIRSIKEMGVKTSAEDLAKLSVHDLNLIFQSHDLKPEKE